MRIVALSHEDGSDTFTPDFFNRRQDPEFVVDQNVLVCRIATGHVFQFVFLVDIDQHRSIKSIVQSSLANLVRLKDDISVGKNHWQPVLLNALNDTKRVSKEPIMKRISQQEMRNSKHVQISRIVRAITLQRAKVICVAYFGAQFFEDRPVALLPFMTNLPFEMFSEIGSHGVVV